MCRRLLRDVPSATARCRDSAMSSARSRIKPLRSICPASRALRAPPPRRARTARRQAKLGKLAGARGDAVHFGGIEVHHFGNQQRLARDAALLHRVLHLLVRQAFVGGVLIDDDDAVFRLRHDIGFVHLGTRRAEGAVRRRRFRLGFDAGGRRSVRKQWRLKIARRIVGRGG